MLKKQGRNTKNGHFINLNDSGEKDIDEETVGLTEDHDLDVEDAAHVQEIMDDYDLDESDAVELKDNL